MTVPLNFLMLKKKIRISILNFTKEGAWDYLCAGVGKELIIYKIVDLFIHYQFGYLWKRHYKESPE